MSPNKANQGRVMKNTDPTAPAGAKYKQYTDAFNAYLDSPDAGMLPPGYIQAALQGKENPDGKLPIGSAMFWESR